FIFVILLITFFIIFLKYLIRIHVLPSSWGRLAQTAFTQEPKACSFTQRPCSQQCSYVSNKNGKRCPNAAPKVENKEW
uniref:Uncharacterized protein n=1 Tax=Salmo trutta TaxID=8032 RepID=A0A674AMU9_SALTR